MKGPDQPWAFVRCDNSGTFRSNQMADNAYPSKVFRLDSPAYPSSLGDWLWPPSCEVALGFAYMMYGADLGTLQVTVTGCWTYDCVDENDYTEVELWSVSGNNPLREWEEAVVHLPPGTSYVSFVATTGSGALSDFALDSIRMFDFHPTAAPTVTPATLVKPDGVPVRAAHVRADDLHPAVAGAVHKPRADDADAVDGLADDVAGAFLETFAKADGGADVAEEQQEVLLLEQLAVHHHHRVRRRRRVTMLLRRIYVETATDNTETRQSELRGHEGGRCGTGPAGHGVGC